jgi:putative ABC transport system permease protein
MIQNYVIVALRNLRRQLSYSIINISGLAIGIACSLVMFMYVYSEWSYDRHFKNADRIYRIGISFFTMGDFAGAPEVLGEYLPTDFEGVEALTRIKPANEVAFRVSDQVYSESVYYTDSSFFKVLSYEFVEGDRHTALKQPASIVMTEAVAFKYFGIESATGKVIEIGNDRRPFTITGIVKDDNRSSEFRSSIWLSNESQLKGDSTWTTAGAHNYVLLKEGITQRDLEEALNRIKETRVYPQSPMDAKTFEDYLKDPNAVKFIVYPLLDVHLKSHSLSELTPVGTETRMYTFAAISFFILLLASVNFINLTTARATKREKEIGIRKVIGSGRGKLVVQFVMESVMISLIATVLSVALAEVFLNLFQLITEQRLLNILWDSIWNIPVLFAFAIFVGLISGIYPAFYLTSFNPVKVLKGVGSRMGGSQFRNLLVVVQFSISICLMICSSIIIRQMNFMQTKDLGFNQEGMVTIDNMRFLKLQAESFKNELSRLPGVAGSSLHTGEPGSKAVMSYYGYQVSGKDAITICSYLGDADFVDVMGFHIIKGRSFNKDLASDSSAIIINESAAKVFGLKDPLGAVVNNDQHIIGVVSDFHWESLRNSIAPLAIVPGKKRYHQLGIRLTAKAANDFLRKAEEKWKVFVPDEPFKYHFLDDNFGELLRQEKVFGKAIAFFTVLATFISCLGLYGLSAFTAEQRTREIGIRKVLGATAYHIVGMLNRKFALLVSISILVSIPVASYLMSIWMQGFAYRAELQVWLFLSAIAGAFAVAFLTVSFHSLKAALMNPAETLKYE